MKLIGVAPPSSEGSSNVWESIGWEGKESYLLAPTHSDMAMAPLLEKCLTKLQKEFFDQKETVYTNLESHFFVFSSGTQSMHRRLIGISRKAMLSSAESVNSWIKANSEDIWINVLPIYHVGGLSIIARSHLSRSKQIHKVYEKWNPSIYCEDVKLYKATLGSLVPAQLHSLVKAQLTAPQSLRVVFIGAGACDEDLYFKARDLGWPILLTYGMTELGSQVATMDLSSLDRDFNKTNVKEYSRGQFFKYYPLKVLPHIEMKIEEESRRISLRSEALLSIQIEMDEASSADDDSSGSRTEKIKIIAHKLFPEGSWYKTQDFGKVLSNKSFFFEGRSSHLVKTGGKLVNLNRIEKTLHKILMGNDEFMLFSVSSKKWGEQICLALGGGYSQLNENRVRNYNQNTVAWERVKGIYFLDKIPRTELNKKSLSQLKKILDLDGDS